MKYEIIVFGLVCLVFVDSIARVEEKIWKNLEEDETTNVLVTFTKANTKAAYERFHSMKLITKAARRTVQRAILKEHADIVQTDVTDMLNKAASNGKKHRIAQLWITNELIVRNVDKVTVEKLSQHPDVESLKAEWFILLDDVVEEEIVSPNNTLNLQWGVGNVDAEAVWNTGNRGQNAVIGVIDTGARFNHTMLRDTYRGNSEGGNHNYNWFDPNGNLAAPIDNNGHGTHVIGSAAGTGGIGVAPSARWITCRGCATASCSNFDLMQCGHWMICPWNLINDVPDCSRAPDVVNNSWGGGSNDPWYDAIIAAWLNAGIVPIFSSGNSGPLCSTLVSPGDRPGTIAIASIAVSNQRSGFSSNGPSNDGRQNPLIAAPGTSIPSASHLDDVSLRTLSGTSMAAPHVTGVVALLFSRNPAITVSQVEQALIRGAVPHTTTGTVCGGIPENVFPNYFVGHGRINALNAVNSIQPLGNYE